MGDWCDFNDAPDSVGAQTIDADAVRRELSDRLESMLAYLFPNGVTRNGTFQVGDLHGSKGNSLSVELAGDKRGLWTDFATGEGGDVIDLWAGVHALSARTDFHKVIEGAAEWLGAVSWQNPLSADRTTATDSCKATKQPPMDELGPRTGKWDYTTADGSLICCVYRHDPPGGKKTFRPWDAMRQKFGDPTPWPLYNQPGIAQADTTVLVEGEKCADALNGAGFCATTAMHGAGALSKTSKTDWSPLRGKQVIVWPDKDAVGWRYAEAVADAAAKAGARSVAILVPPEDKPEKWDAADAVAEGFDCAGFIRDGERKTVKVGPPAWEDFTPWSSGRYDGPAPEQQFLVDDVFPLGVVGILAAMGDTGKGMFTLDLALKVARKGPRGYLSNPDTAFGGVVRAEGAVVILSAEDDAGEIHRRLERLDRYGWRKQCADRLWIVPLPNAGGPFPIVSMGQDGPQATPQFEKLRDQLTAINDLKLVVFDPLSSFIHADVSSDPAAGSFATGLLASLATETGATVLVPHHMRKPPSGRPISTPEAARDAIRGTSALVDGVRVAYALWPPDDDTQKEAFERLERKWERNSVFQGAVVKSNGPADRLVRTYVRNNAGLLEDRTAQVKVAGISDMDLLDTLMNAIARSAKLGHPFTHTGQGGLYYQRERLPAMFHDMSKNRLETLGRELLTTRPPRLVKVKAAGSNTNKWLDVPDGPFARGEGDFVRGAEPNSPDGNT
ncbi:MAG: AAA family ATPase [Nitrospirota bacterium]|nr:AAA family ATPase [Nitrospirota bacterium]